MHIDIANPPIVFRHLVELLVDVVLDKLRQRHPEANEHRGNHKGDLHYPTRNAPDRAHIKNRQLRRPWSLVLFTEMVNRRLLTGSL
jgi:hypothetical protein